MYVCMMRVTYTREEVVRFCYRMPGCLVWGVRRYGVKSTPALRGRYGPRPEGPRLRARIIARTYRIPESTALCKCSVLADLCSLCAS
jgi:hypothetical protein